MQAGHPEVKRKSVRKKESAILADCRCEYEYGSIAKYSARIARDA
jgi:hypothetical protein